MALIELANVEAAFGGGLWMKPVGQQYMFRAGFGSSTESTKVFVSLGLPY